MGGAGSNGGSSGGSRGGPSGGSSSSNPSGGSSGSANITKAAQAKASKKLDDRSLGEALSGGTERVATAKPAAAGTRAAQAVGEEGGGAGLLWLLLALGAITAVAAGGVAVRRRQARQGFSR